MANLEGSIKAAEHSKRLHKQLADTISVANDLIEHGGEGLSEKEIEKLQSTIVDLQKHYNFAQSLEVNAVETAQKILVRGE